MINSSLGELGCLIRIISSLGISVHGSAYRPHHVRGSSTRYNPYPTPTHLITNSIRPHLENASSRICLDGFSWYFDKMIIRWGDSRGVQELGVKGHLGVNWDRCSNMLKTLLRLHNSIDFDETWVKRSLAGVSFGVFRNLWSEVILGSLLKGQILNSLLQQIWLCQCLV